MQRARRAPTPYKRYRRQYLPAVKTANGDSDEAQEFRKLYRR
ncbi:MAG: hypothetical protein ACI9DC_000163, partial [Gammaproteobacteria bacterium]